VVDHLVVSPFRLR